MIEALKSEDVLEQAGGRFRLCALIQRRLQQLVDGARPMVDRDGRTDLEVAVHEITEGLIELYEDDSVESDGVLPPADAPLL